MVCVNVTLISTICHRLQRPASDRRSIWISACSVHIMARVHTQQHANVPLACSMQSFMSDLPPTGAASSHVAPSSSSSMGIDPLPPVAQIQQPISAPDVRRQKQHARCVCPIDCTHDKSTRCSWAAYVLGRNRCATEAKATRMPLRRETLRPSAQARRARGVQPLRRASSERTASSVERCTGQASISCCCLSSTSPPQQSPSQRLFHSDDHNT